MIKLAKTAKIKVEKQKAEDKKKEIIPPEIKIM